MGDFGVGGGSGFTGSVVAGSLGGGGSGGGNGGGSGGGSGFTSSIFTATAAPDAELAG